jgi:hypothetical protein
MAFRFGKYASIVQDQWGEKPAYLFRKIATLGQTTLNHLIAECDKDKSHTINPHELRRIIHDFLKYGYLQTVTKFCFQPQHLFEAEVESQILSFFKGEKPKGKDKELAEKLRVKFRRRMRDEAFHYQEKENEPPTKRRKLAKPNGIKKPLVEVVQNLSPPTSPSSSSAPDVITHLLLILI